MAPTAWSVLMLLAVLALIPPALWLLKRMQAMQRGPASDRPLELAAQLSLGARERVVLVRVNDRLLVLGVTAQQVTLLGDGGAVAETPAHAGAGFERILDSLRARR